jgi:predicted TIM-barrel fold metal-dependent hydrolase
MNAINKIDVHHHPFPIQYVNAIKKVGIKKTLGVDFPIWTPETSLKVMDDNGIRTAILSITAPGVYSPDPDICFPDSLSRQLSRVTNEIIAEIKEQYPERFGGFATIPMLNPEHAIEELNYAIDHLKLDGVCLMSNYRGTYLGDEIFDPFFKELNKRKTVVYIHPASPKKDLASKITEIPDAIIEAPFDTTRAVTNLMFRGSLEKYSEIKYILSHGGGTIPFLAWRLSAIAYKGINSELADALIKEGEPTKGLELLKKMYYDTALVSGRDAIEALQHFVGSKNIVFGSDFYVAKEVSPTVTKNFIKNGDFTAQSLKDMQYGNCLELFPHFKKYYE